MYSKVVFVHFGKFKSKEYKDIFEEYFKRLSHYTKVELKELKVEKDEPSFFEKIKAKVLDTLKDSTVMVLTERGKTLDSKEFSDFINRGTGVLSVVVGTSWGVPSYIEELALMKLSFGKLTMPHEAVRALSAEQLYRAYTIIKGESYHK
jgi:23S rRNA (pseudouridine1915-N3)-methyltransferase